MNGRRRKHPPLQKFARSSKTKGGPCSGGEGGGKSGPKEKPGSRKWKEPKRFVLTAVVPDQGGEGRAVEKREGEA